MATLEDLKKAAEQIDVLERLRSLVQQRRDDLVLALYSAGERVQEIAYTGRISEARAYQIVRAGPDAVAGWFDGDEARLRFDELGEFLDAFVLRTDEDGEQVEELP